MHRSHTSLIANWLYKTGLNLGERLIGATPSNIFGHFEDVDIVEFHEELLKFNKTTLYAGIEDTLNYNSSHIKKAQYLLNKRNNKNINWGWKQPRSALFLDLWLKVLPENSYFFLPYRDYTEVVNSLYIREYNKLSAKNPHEKVSRKQKEFINAKDEICNSYLSMWIRHNSEILKLRKKLNNMRLLYISLTKLLEYNDFIFNTIKNKWYFDNLNFIDIKKIYEPNNISKPAEKFYFNLNLKKQADEIFQELKNSEKLSLQMLKE